MKNNIKYNFFIILFFIFNKLNAYEIIRDPIFEDYFLDLSNELNLNITNVYLVKNNISNAFVINDNIYFTTGLLNVINEEDTIKAIFLHEYAHVINNHFQFKKIKIQQSNKKSTFYNLFSVGLAALVGDMNIGLGTSITLNTKLIDSISKHSINFEIEADNFMINQIKKNQINTSELISFLDKSSDQINNYFRSHPKKEDRINNLIEFSHDRSNNSYKFEWLKSKYSKNSKNNSFNKFFKNLDKGIFDKSLKIEKINENLVHYEVFKKGIFVENWPEKFENLLIINKNSFLKIEYINYLLENNLRDKYYIIEDLKFSENIINEHFYYYIFGKYYNKINNINLSNYYFCQFYKSIDLKNKTVFFCKKYDIKDIPTLDKSYALFK